MGRLLEALSQPDGRRSVPPPASPPNEVVESTDAEVPFIEIGSPPRNKPMPTPTPKPASVTGTAPGEMPTPGAKSETALRATQDTVQALPGLVKPLTIHFQPLPANPTCDEPRDLQVSPELIAYHQAEHVVSGQYCRLAEQLREQLGPGEARAVVLCGANRSAGTTTVALNLAITLARASERVAVLDANVQRPAVAAKLGLAGTPGLAEVLTRRAPLPWALRAGPVAGLHVLACPSGVMLDAQATARLAAVVDGLRAKHDWVIVDAGVIGGAEVLAVLTACCDATYLVLRQEDIDLPELASVQAQLQANGGQLRGYVLTQV
jgi:Mrp family chromosome partitioning ATPase